MPYFEINENVKEMNFHTKDQEQFAPAQKITATNDRKSGEIAVNLV